MVLCDAARAAAPAKTSAIGNTAEILPRNPVVEGSAEGEVTRELPLDIKVSLRRGRGTLLCRMVKQDINAIRIRLLAQSSCAEMNARHD